MAIPVALHQPIPPPVQKLQTWARFVHEHWRILVATTAAGFWFVLTSMGLLNVVAIGNEPNAFLGTWNGVRSALKLAFIIPLVFRMPLDRLTLPRVTAAILLTCVGAEWWYHLTANGFVFGLDGLAETAAVMTLLSLGGAFSSVSGLVFALIVFRLAAASHQRSVTAAAVVESAYAAHNQVLRWQTNPHLLFNALNALAALIRKDETAARRYLASITFFYSRVRDLDPERPVTLRQELELAKSYIEIERVRFGGTITLTVDAADEALDVLVPPLLLQPLIENAVKHGGRHDGDLVVNVVAAIRGTLLEITVQNRVIEESAVPTPGFGLRIVRERLAHLHAGAARFDVEVNGGMFCSRIALPLAC